MASSGRGAAALSTMALSGRGAAALALLVASAPLLAAADTATLALLVASASLLAAADKVTLARDAGLTVSGSPSAPSSGGIVVTEVGGAVTDGTEVWSNYSLAIPAWTTESDVAFSLWGGGNFAAYQWGGAPLPIADYACQGAYIMEKTLAHARAGVDDTIASWLLSTLPYNPDGKPWEAQNSEMHVSHQGAWEAGGEVLAQMRIYAAHTGDLSLFQVAPERLVCASADGGATWTLAGAVRQPGITNAICLQAPQSLPDFPGAAPAHPPASLYYDIPSAPFTSNAPSGGYPLVYNSGRALSTTVALAGPFTTLALPLARRAGGGATVWWANITVLDARTGAVVATAVVQPNATAGHALGSAWTVVDVSSSLSAAPAPAGLYTIILAAEDDSPTDAGKPGDSWFLAPVWVTNMRPAAPGGGAGQLTYGNTTFWLRDPGAPTSRPALATNRSATLADAVAVELQRVRYAEASRGYLGVSLGDAAALVLSHTLALSSQLPRGAGALNDSGGGDALPSSTSDYDVFIIPDPFYRGTGEDGVNTGCSYYDVIRIGFASSYIALRTLEGLAAYAELQAAGALPSACPAGSSVGTDNGRTLQDGSIPCYTGADVEAIVAAVTVAVGDRFASATTGAMLDWVGCTCLGQQGAAVADCGFEDVHNGTLPASGAGSGCLTSVATDFVPSAALAAKLGVPAGGVSLASTRANFERVRDAGRDAGNASYGPGWWHTALRGLETAQAGAGTWVADVGWALRSAGPSGGWAERSENETGDWHFFDPASVADGGSTGYGNFPTNAENGGKFFTTSAMVWEAHSSPGGAAAAGPYPAIYADWKRLLGGVSAAGKQLAARDTSTPLLPGDRGFLSTPVADPLVTYLCVKVRQQFHFKNVTDLWGEQLCDFYQDLGWGTPENGVAFYSFAKGLLGLRPCANGTVALLGAQSPRVSGGMAPWTLDGVPLPPGWPAEVEGVEVRALLVNGASVDVKCAVSAGSVGCTLAPPPAAREEGEKRWETEPRSTSSAQ
jgi:hypothetical protein